MELQIADKIDCYQKGDPDSALILVRVFTPLLKKYAYMLRTEDAYEDLQCYLLETLKGISIKKLNNSTNGAIINYVQQAIYHKYISISKAARMERSVIHIEDLSVSDALQYDTRFSIADDCSCLLLADMRNILSEKEYQVISLYYFKRHSIAKIAKQMEVSRQAVNQTKNKALRKLEKAWR